MRFSRMTVVFLFAILCLPTIAAAATMYVTDQLVITLRQGKGTEYKVLKTLKTGTPMEVLEKTEGDNYVKVRLESGEEGYVLGQYLTDETPKPIIISGLEKQVETAQTQLAQAKEDLGTVTEKYKTLQENSGKVVEITNDLDQFKKANTKLASEVQSLTRENSNLARTGAIQWFLAGAGVLLFGWILGKVSRKKQRGLY